MPFASTPAPESLGGGAELPGWSELEEQPTKLAVPKASTARNKTVFIKRVPRATERGAPAGNLRPAGAGGDDQLRLATSPPLRVERAGRTVLLLYETNRAEPSPIRNCAPPEWPNR